MPDELGDGVARFDDAAATYHEARPGWPAELVKRMAERIGLAPGSTVVDLAAGTGKLTAPLARAFGRVIAVEPSAAMRADLERHRPETTDAPGAAADSPGGRVGAAGVSAVSVHDGRAEAIPVADAAADAVAVGEAFHWFATPEAVGEIARVLRPGGGVALLWNRVGDGHSSGWGPIAEIVRAVREHPVAAAQARAIAGRKGGGEDGWRAAFVGSPFGPFSHDLLPNPETLDPERLVALVASWSWVATLPAAERARVLAQVGERAQGHGPLEVPYDAHLWTARLR